MGRYKQKSDGKGSLKLIQALINEYKHVINRKLSKIINANIIWISPLATDEYAEYRDRTFIEKLELDGEVTKNLKEFWPRNGPQWDALARYGENGVLLVEAKANLQELASPPSSSKSPISQQLIAQALRETKKYICANSSADWTGNYYQYLNRLAHLYFFRVLNGIPAYLIMIYFIGDTTVNGPSSQKQWEIAIERMNQKLGIPDYHPLKPYIKDIFIHVNELQ